MRVIYAWKANRPLHPFDRTREACSTNPRIVGKMPPARARCNRTCGWHGPHPNYRRASTLCVTLSANPSCWSPNSFIYQSTHLHCPRPRNLERPRAETANISQEAEERILDLRKTYLPRCRAYHTNPRPWEKSYVVFRSMNSFTASLLFLRAYSWLCLLRFCYRQQVFPVPSQQTTFFFCQLLWQEERP